MRDEILELERNGHLDEATARARAWAQSAPQDAEARHLYALALLRNGDAAAALIEADAAATLAPQAPMVQLTRGRAAMASGDAERARAAFEQARALDPNLAGAHAGLASLALGAGDLAAAESGYRTALRADGDDPHALLGLGQVLALKGDLAAAGRCFGAAIELLPDEPTAQVSLGLTLLAQGHYDFAVRAFENALARQPDYAYARLLLGEAELRRRGFDAAVQAFDALLEHPQFASAAQAGRGDVALARAAAGEAQTWFERALARDPASERAALGRARRLNAQGFPAPACDGLAAFVDGYPAAHAARSLLAELLQGRGQVAEALALWRDGVARYPEIGSLRGDLALALERSGDFDAADSEAEHAAARGRWAPLTLLRARAALRAGAYNLARDRLATLDRERLIDRQTRQRFHLLGLAHDGAGRYAEALLAFREQQRIDAGPLPALPDLAIYAETLQTLAVLPGSARARHAPPLLLVGLPGAGADRLAALLADQPDVRLRRDHFDGGTDCLATAADPRLLGALAAGELEVLARRYARGHERLGAAADTLVVDWLPHLDARVLPVLKRVLPGVRLLIAARDPSACLLDWLAFGYRRGYADDDPQRLTRWLRAAQSQLDFAARVLPTHAVDMDALLDDDAASRAALAQWLGRERLEDGPQAAAAARALGLPTRFPRGHLDHYRALLGGALAEQG